MNGQVIPGELRQILLLNMRWRGGRFLRNLEIMDVWWNLNSNDMHIYIYIYARNSLLAHFLAMGEQ